MVLNDSAAPLSESTLSAKSLMNVITPKTLLLQVTCGMHNSTIIVFPCIFMLSSSRKCTAAYRSLDPLGSKRDGETCLVNTSSPYSTLASY